MNLRRRIAAYLRELALDATMSALLDETLARYEPTGVTPLLETARRHRDAARFADRLADWLDPLPPPPARPAPSPRMGTVDATVSGDSLRIECSERDAYRIVDGGDA